MTTVASEFGHSVQNLTASHPSIVMQCHVGIELELEGVNNIRADLWNCTEDGSLRNGCEMVCSRPYNGQQLFRAIHNLSTSVAASQAEGTWRCSTHVHVDMRDADVNIVKKTILAYSFYEKMLFKCSGFHRYRSNFCPAFGVVQAQVMNASTAFNHRGGRFYAQLVSTWDKYTSLNLLPLREFGSIEFRISEPKWKRSQLLNLVNRFLMLKKLAVDNAEMTNDDFIEHLNNVRFEPMIDHLPLDYTPDEDDLNSGYRLARDVLYCRDESVSLVPRMRIRQPRDNGDVIVALADISSFHMYLGFIRRESTILHTRIVRRWGEEIESGEMTEARFRELITYLRESGTSNDNITQLVPDNWEALLDELLSSS